MQVAGINMPYLGRIQPLKLLVACLIDIWAPLYSGLQIYIS